MKKAFSAVAAAAILICSMLPVAFAEAIPETALPVVAGESVSYEIENYRDQFYAGSKQITSGINEGAVASLSGGKGVYSGGAGTATVTISFPVTVSEDTFYEVETVTAVAGHLSSSSWLVDGEKAFTATTGNGTNQSFTFTEGSGSYPAYKHTFSILLTAGSHTLTYSAPPRGSNYGGTVAFAMDYVKLTATDASIPTIAFPEGAAASAKTGGNVVAVTYDNSAVMTQDGEESYAPYYRVDILSSGARLEHLISSNAFATEVKNGAVSPTHTRHITIGSTLCGTFYAKIYPMTAGSAAVGAIGEPIVTAPFTISELPAHHDAIRVELEDAWVNSGQPEAYVEASSYASGGGFVFSAQGSEWHTHQQWTRPNAEKNPITVSFDVTIPEDGTYDIETVLNNPQGSSYLSEVVVKLDGEEILSNHDTAAKSLGIDGSFPWSTAYNRAALYTTQKELTAKTYTVTYEFCPPAVDTQPYLFNADYIQFAPVADAVVCGDAESVIELENYTSNAVYDDAANPGNKPNDIAVATSANASGGSYFRTDSYAAEDLNLNLLISIPVNVEKTGLYAFEVVDSNSNSNSSVKIDNTTTIISSLAQGTSLASAGLDVQDSVTSKWSYFHAEYHGARKSTAEVYLTAGAHTVDFCYLPRSTNNTTAIIDYMKFTPIDGIASSDADNNVFVTACFDSAASGKAIIAAYSGYELVGVSIDDITDTAEITGTVACKSAPDMVKVMVWEDFQSVAPVIKVIEIDVK